MRHIKRGGSPLLACFAIAVAAVLTSHGPAAAQTVTCAATDTACRVQHNDSAALGAKLDAILAQLKAAPPAQPSGTASAPPGPVAASDPCANNAPKWSTLAIDPSVSIAAALACANPGFKLTLKAGLYNQVFDVPAGLDGWDIGGESAATVKLSGQGGCTVSQNNSGACPTRLAWGKGVIHLSSAGTVHDVEVADGGTNATDGHDGQAGIYVDQGVSGPVLIRHVMLRHNQNGVFANASNTGVDLTMEEDDFVANSVDGGSHSSYISGGKSLTLKNIHDYGSTLGNDQKSRVATVTSTDGFYKSVQGRWIECADGCQLTITGGTFVGNTCCQNMFGNGTESTNKGPGNTTWSGSTIWLGRPTDFANAGSFTASNMTLACGGSGQAFNDHNTALTGLPGCPSAQTAPPADPPFISGAK